MTVAFLMVSVESSLFACLLVSLLLKKLDHKTRPSIEVIMTTILYVVHHIACYLRNGREG